MLNQLTIQAPDDMHLHLRDGTLLELVAPLSARQFARAVIMPNLVPPITEVEAALLYRDRILAACAKAHIHHFEPLMTLYLTAHTTSKAIEAARRSNAIVGIKYYPAHATTNAEQGVQDLIALKHILAIIEDQGLVLQLHGEVNAAGVDIFAREQVFVESTLPWLIESFPRLRIVLEHITTEVSVNFVKQAPANVAATITPQHLRYERNHLFLGGIRPHFYCLPILKKESDRLALIQAATSGNPKFFLGSDSAPHPQAKKENACGCAGMFSAANALELYAEVFDQAGALNRLQGFASEFGAHFYQLSQNQTTITLLRAPSLVSTHIGTQDFDRVIPMEAGKTLAWRLEKSLA